MSKDNAVGSGEGRQQEGQDITIEICVAKYEDGKLACANQNVMFHPMRKTLRGRWDTGKLPRGTTSTSHDSKLMELDVVPGMRVTLNPSTGRAKVFDPLGLPEYAEIKESVNSVTSVVFGYHLKAEDTKEYRLGKDAIATWYHWMKALVDQNLAILAPGCSWLKATPPGRIKVNHHDTGHNAKRFLDEFTEDRPGADYASQVELVKS